MFSSPSACTKYLVRMAKLKTKGDLAGVSEMIETTGSFKTWSVRNIAEASWALTELEIQFPLTSALERFNELSTRTKVKGVDWAQMSVAVAASAEPENAMNFFRGLNRWVRGNATSLSPVDILVLSSSVCHLNSRL